MCSETSYFLSVVRRCADQAHRRGFVSISVPSGGTAGYRSSPPRSLSSLGKSGPQNKKKAGKPARKRMLSVVWVLLTHRRLVEGRGRRERARPMGWPPAASLMLPELLQRSG